MMSSVPFGNILLSIFAFQKVHANELQVAESSKTAIKNPLVNGGIGEKTVIR